MKHVENLIGIPNDFFDLLSASVANSEIFIINTQSHGAGSDYVVMCEVVKYLHAHHGFTNLCMASSFYDCYKINDPDNSTPLKQRIRGSLFRMYANSSELESLYDYIDHHRDSRNPLVLHGIDIPMGGEISNQNLIFDLSKWLIDKKFGIEVQSLKYFFECCQSYISLASFKVEPDIDEIKAGFLKLDAILATGIDEEFIFWKLVLDNVRSKFESSQFSKSRDLQMARNFQYIFNSTQRKTIVWGHACHGLPMAGLMGGYIKEWYGANVYSCLLTSHQGSITNFETLQSVAINTSPVGFLEENLFSNNVDFAFISANECKLYGATNDITCYDGFQVKLIGYDFSCSLSRVFSFSERSLIDSIIYTKEVSPTKQLNFDLSEPATEIV